MSKLSFNQTQVPDTLSFHRRKKIVENIEYIIENSIQGDIVVCGAYCGSSTIFAIQTLISKKDLSRDIYIFDTFEGMPKPTQSIDGEEAYARWEKLSNSETGWCKCSLEQVTEYIKKHCPEYPGEKVHLVKGMVEDTLPTLSSHINQIAACFLDTDFYESTLVELTVLYPKVVEGGIVSIDDYNSKFIGCTRAVEEFFQNNNLNLDILNSINPKEIQSKSGAYFFKT